MKCGRFIRIDEYGLGLNYEEKQTREVQVAKAGVQQSMVNVDEKKDGSKVKAV